MQACGIAAPGTHYPSTAIAVPPAQLEGLLRSRGAVQIRLGAVVAIGRLPACNAVPLLQRALHDSADEVRLVAFSRLENLRNRIETQIGALRAQLPDAGPQAKAELHQRLAEGYAELAYLGLVDGELGRRSLRAAAMHAEVACRRASPQSVAVSHFLMGRIRLREGKGTDATRSFQLALACGMPLDTLAPYLAEAAFGSSDLGAVRAWVRNVRHLPTDHLILSRVVAFWR